MSDDVKQQLIAGKQEYQRLCERFTTTRQQLEHYKKLVEEKNEKGL